jgi:4-hydroxyproline epimerase
MANLHRIQVVDSHTGGEPTRVVISGGPDLGTGPLSERVQRLSSQFDPFRSAVVNEPRGSDVLVGALLVAPHAPDCDFGVIFFNNVGPLGMCGHGTIGLMITLAHLGRVRPGTHRIDTPVGPVSATLHEDGSVSVANVPSYRHKSSVVVQVPGIGAVSGDVAWGGNWFFLVRSPVWELSIQNVETLTDVSWRIRQAVNAQGFPEVDHVELFGHPGCGGHSRNFVLCPGKAYDRSPCGTGTSAKLACLAADEKLAPGQVWIQEGILGSSFQGEYQWEDRARGRVLPVVTGTAHVTAEATLILSDVDPFQWGIRPD